MPKCKKNSDKSIKMNDLFSLNLSEYVSDYKKFKLSKFENEKVYIPTIGKINPKLYYSLDEYTFYRSKVYIGNNIFTKIGNNIYIRFEGNSKFYTNKWFINTIKKINRNYKKIFGEIKPLYFQIKQIKNLNKSEEGILGVGSLNGIEIILNRNKTPPDENIYCKKVKWIIAHELFHLYFPSLNNMKYKYSLCWDEGLVDYLSLYFNFTNKDINYMIHHQVEEFKKIDKRKDEEYYNHRKPYINGLLIGHNLSKSKLHKLISFIKQYNHNRKNMFEQIDDINFVKKMGFYNLMCR